MPIRRSLVLVLASLLSVLIQNARAAPELPDTPAGHCAQAFIDAWNSGSFETRLAFEHTYASDTRLAQRDAEERASSMAGLRERFGALEINRVFTDPEGMLMVVVTTHDQALEMGFMMSDAQPGRLDGVRIASGGPVGGSVALSPEERAHAVERVAQAVEDNYVFPDVGATMANALRDNLEAGAYDSIERAMALAARLTDDLRAISKDRHLGVRPASPPGDGPDEIRVPGDAARSNYAFKKVELLGGNIGYVRLDGFVPGEAAERTAAAAMAFVAHSDALIFDLRYNGGGSPEMIRFLTSYLFDEPTHLNDMIDRQGNVVAEFWTLDEVPGTRLGESVPVFVLTSDYSFSGAEEFAYNLQNLRRATIVGETTGGGAHPVRPHRAGDHFTVGVPFMRARNPISGTNWEGSGVSPDVPASAEKALDRAIELAREAIDRQG